MSVWRWVVRLAKLLLLSRMRASIRAHDEQSMLLSRPAGGSCGHASTPPLLGGFET